MNNEIKELLDKLKEEIDLKPLWYSERIKLLDYITNLQQENERLKENAIHNDKVVDKAKWNEMIYKSRCEKASDNLKRNYWINEHEHNDDVVNMTLNILQNGSDSQ